MKQFRKAILVVMLSLCSLVSYASDYDTDYIDIPQSYINSSSNSQLLEKAARIFGKTYRLTLRNIYLSEYWFYCDIVIEHFEEDFDVTQTCSNEYPQNESSSPATTSSIRVGKTAYDIVIHSEVRLYRDDNDKTITVTYHFTEKVPSSGNYNQDDYFLVITFPYNRDTITGIGSVECEPLSVEYFDIQGRKLNGPQPGIVIEKQGNKTTKKLYR
jgi:hypothetical protein